MVRKIRRIGGSVALVFDTQIRRPTGLKAGDKVHVSVYDRGEIVLVPMDASLDPATAQQSADRAIGAHRENAKRLA